MNINAAFDNLLNYSDVAEPLPGIYGIISEQHRHIYIGSATNMLKRKKEHIYKLNKNIHHCKYLQNSWNKYGSTSFRFIMVEHLPTLNHDKSIERIRRFRYEQKYIDLFDNSGYLYNSNKIAGNYKQFTISIEDKIREISTSYINEYILDFFETEAGNISKKQEIKENYNHNIERLKNEWKLIEDRNIEIDNTIVEPSNQIDTANTMEDIKYIYIATICLTLSLVALLFNIPYYEYISAIFSIFAIILFLKALYNLLFSNSTDNNKYK